MWVIYVCGKMLFTISTIILKLYHVAYHVTYCFTLRAVLDIVLSWKCLKEVTRNTLRIPNSYNCAKRTQEIKFQLKLFKLWKTCSSFFTHNDLLLRKKTPHMCCFYIMIKKQHPGKCEHIDGIPIAFIWMRNVEVLPCDKSFSWTPWPI